MTKFDYKKGDIFESEANVLVNPVNTIGISGKGLALEFKKRFPNNYTKYKEACESGKLTIGSVLITYPRVASNPPFIANFPTKAHWKSSSNYEIIRDGLHALRQWIRETSITSIAIPALGCGLGGLYWDKVRQLIVHYLDDIDDLRVDLFEPLNW